jgi:hypothetical protein
MLRQPLQFAELFAVAPFLTAAQPRRLHALGATRSSETADKRRGMEGKGQVIEDSHGLSVTKNLDNCASIQVR